MVILRLIQIDTSSSEVIYVESILERIFNVLDDRMITFTFFLLKHYDLPT